MSGLHSLKYNIKILFFNEIFNKKFCLKSKNNG